MNKDKDLAFLATCKNDDLRTLCDILTYNNKGEIRLSEQLTDTDAYLNCYPNRMNMMVTEIAEELRKFGSNTVRTICRKGEADSYETIVRRVCKRMGVKMTDCDNTPNYGTCEKLTLDEVRSILAHECGHILCQHTLYNTLLRTIEELGILLRVISRAAFAPILMAMQYWSRKSELSADRCAAVIVGERVFQTAMLKLTCGMSSIQGSPYQLVEQAREYHRFENDSWWNRIQQNCRIAFNSHPQMCERAYEIDRWKNSWQYRRLRNQ